MSQPEPNYRRVIREMAARGEIPDDPLVDLDVKHDDWCAVLNGRAICDCDPVVTVRKHQDA